MVFGILVAAGLLGVLRSDRCSSAMAQTAAATFCAATRGAGASRIAGTADVKLFTMGDASMSHGLEGAKISSRSPDCGCTGAHERAPPE